ncbi:MAG: HEAT repeat domain-containing protein [Candidatus Hodarchaeota archaeon]
MDLDKINYDDLIKREKKKSLEWLEDELNIQGKDSIPPSSLSVEENHLRLAKDLLPYFENASRDPNPKVRDFANKGIKDIQKKFPWFKKGGFSGN